MAIKKYNRKEFIQMASLAGAGILLNACKNNNTETVHADEIPDSTSVIKDTVPQFTIDKNILADKYDSRYEMLRQRFNKNINKYPRVIALCRNTEDVSAAVQYAVKNKLHISIKSGGHSFEGFSVNDDGMVIDLSQMQKVSWTEETRISVEPGCTLSKLYDTILPQKRILPVGSCAGVGIGGLTLGGGYGLFSRKYGLTCDSLEALTLVDGKGNIISAKNNDELLWACKGGGNGNFGVVTEMQFKTYAAPALFQSHRFKAYQLNTERAKTILQTWFILMKELPESCFSAFVLNGKTLTVLITNFEEHTTALQNILDVLKNETDKFTLGNKIETAKALKTFYGVQTPIYFKNASAGYYTDFSDIENCISPVFDKVISSGMIYQVNTLGGKIMDKEFAEKSAYAHRQYSFLSELQAYWEKPEQQEKYIREFRDVQKIFSENNIRAQYVNYPALEFENYTDAYYGNNYKRLQQVKLKYDEENIFRYAQSITLS